LCGEVEGDIIFFFSFFSREKKEEKEAKRERKAKYKKYIFILVWFIKESFV